MTDKKLMQMALEMLHHINKFSLPPASICLPGEIDDVMEAISVRLAQPEQEPVAWMYEYGTDHGDAVNQIFWHKNLRLEKPTGLVRNVVPLYTAPPQRQQRTYTLRKWQGLTDEEYEAMAETYVTNCYFDTLKYAKAIEAKLKEKNSA